jgi:hypothetical protein
MQDSVRELLQSRCKRTCRIILDAKDRLCDPHMSELDSEKFREIVLDQVNDFKSLFMTLLESFDDGDVLLNELWIKRLEEMYEVIQSLTMEVREDD